MKRHLLLSISLLLCVVAAGLTPRHAAACSVPVFRYALERWGADPFDLVVHHRGPLTAEQQAAVDFLSAEQDTPSHFANLYVTLRDLDETTPSRALPTGALIDPPQAPWLTLHPPRQSGVERPVWAGPLTMESAKVLIDSPGRQELVKRIRTGETAVWLLIETGRAAEDNAAAAVVEAAIKEATELFKMPDITEEDLGIISLPEGAPPLRIAFSIQRVRRDDPAEAALLAVLMQSEEDLPTFDKPMAFPVFGRGRALFALVGEGINRDNLLDASAFLTGSCSCEVKWMNPGVDLLVNCDWDAMMMGGASFAEDELPPLTGMSAFAPAGELATDGAATTATTAGATISLDLSSDNSSAQVSRQLTMGLLLAGLVMIAAIGLASMMLRRRP